MRLASSTPWSSRKLLEVNQKMLENENKSKTIIFNYTNNYKFTTRLKINDKPLEVIDSKRLLGTIISDDLKWDLNCARIVKKANARHKDGAS